MKKTYLLSLLALGISAACHAETYPAPIGNPLSRILAAWDYYRPQPRAWRVKGS